MAEPVDSQVYSEDYFLERCGGIEFFKQYGNAVLKPAMQAAVKAADLSRRHKILDVGCGRGELVAHLTDKGFDAVGIDYSIDAIRIAKAQHPKAVYHCVDSKRLDFPDRCFDRIFLLGTIEHLTDEEINHTLQTLFRLLKPGGICMVTTCTNRLYLKNQTYPFRKGIARFMGRPTPTPPKSSEDDIMHINELHYFTLKSHIKKQGWDFRIKPQPNPKLQALKLYGSHLPPDFPLRAAPPWKQWFYQNLIFWFPLNLLLARSYLIVLTKP